LHASGNAHWAAGQLSLLSYFTQKRETEAVIMYTLGVIFTYTVLVQLAMVESMLVPQFVATSVVVVVGLILNFLNYFGWHPGTSSCCGRISSH